MSTWRSTRIQNISSGLISPKIPWLWAIIFTEMLLHWGSSFSRLCQSTPCLVESGTADVPHPFDNVVVVVVQFGLKHLQVPHLWKKLFFFQTNYGTYLLTETEDSTSTSYLKTRGREGDLEVH